jgi:hypothetical protein
VQELLVLPCFRPTDSRLRLPRAIHASKTLVSPFIPWISIGVKVSKASRTARLHAWSNQPLTVGQ